MFSAVQNDDSKDADINFHNMIEPANSILLYLYIIVYSIRSNMY